MYLRVGGIDLVTLDDGRVGGMWVVAYDPTRFERLGVVSLAKPVGDG
jgi:hypothetical protein